METQPNSSDSTHRRVPKSHPTRYAKAALRRQAVLGQLRASPKIKMALRALGMRWWHITGMMACPDFATEVRELIRQRTGRVMGRNRAEWAETYRMMRAAGLDNMTARAETRRIMRARRGKPALEKIAVDDVKPV